MLPRTKFYKIVNLHMVDLSGLPDCMNYQELIHGGCHECWSSVMVQLDNCGGRFYRLDGCVAGSRDILMTWREYNE